MYKVDPAAAAAVPSRYTLRVGTATGLQVFDLHVHTVAECRSWKNLEPRLTIADPNLSPGVGKMRECRNVEVRD